VYKLFILLGLYLILNCGEKGTDMSWATPKIDYTADTAPTQTDFNRIEGNIADIRFKEGANNRMGLASLSDASSVTVNNTSITANTRIFLTVNSLSSAGTPLIYVSAIVVGTSFTISVSGGASLTATIAYLLLEPQ
jgi:hypothetical protein